MRALTVGGQQRVRSVIPGTDVGGPDKTIVHVVARGDHDCSEFRGHRGPQPWCRTGDSQRFLRRDSQLPQRQPVQFGATGVACCDISQIVDGHDRLDESVADHVPHQGFDPLPAPGAHDPYPDTCAEQAHHRIDEAGSGSVASAIGQRGVRVEDHRTQDIGFGRRFPVPPERPGRKSLPLGSHAHRVPRNRAPSVPH